MTEAVTDPETTDVAVTAVISKTYFSPSVAESNAGNRSDPTEKVPPFIYYFAYFGYTIFTAHPVCVKFQAVHSFLKRQKNALGGSRRSLIAKLKENLPWHSDHHTLFGSH